MKVLEVKLKSLDYLKRVIKRLNREMIWLDDNLEDDFGWNVENGFKGMVRV